MGGLSIWHWLIVLLVVVLIFGTKKLRNIGGDVGGAVKNFKDAMNEEKAVAEAAILNTLNTAAPPLIEGEVVPVPVKTVKKAPAKKAVTTTAKPAATKAKASTSSKAKAETAKAPAKKPAAKKPATKKPTAKPKAASTAKV